MTRTSDTITARIGLAGVVVGVDASTATTTACVTPALLLDQEPSGRASATTPLHTR